MASQYIQALAILMVRAILDGATTQQAIAAKVRETLDPLEISDADLIEAAEFTHATIERIERTKTAKAGA